jgi:hypothetical protein
MIDRLDEIDFRTTEGRFFSTIDRRAAGIFLCQPPLSKDHRIAVARS